MDRRIPPAANVGPTEDFAQEILREFDFGADYDFGREFSFGGYDSSSSVSSFDYEGEIWGIAEDDVIIWQH